MSVADTWPREGGLALSVVVNVEEGAEQSIAEGDKGPEPVDELGVALKAPVRNYANESNYLYGIKAGAPRVLGLLEKYRVPATFTAAAVSLERAPELARRIAGAGHEVCAHGWRWVHQFRMDEGAEREFIAKAVTSIEASTGSRPYGWLSRYLFTENTRRLLAEAGFLYHMDDFSDDLPFWDRSGEKPMLILPYALDSNDMKMWTAPAYTPAEWLDYAVDSFDWLLAEGVREPRMMSLGVHLRIIGRPGRIGAFAKFLEHATSRQGVWPATRLAIAKAWAEAHPA
jgi:peptidoglycan/xylan/chitin deacetylase (PgdA/CDA1 family)